MNSEPHAHAAVIAGQPQSEGSTFTADPDPDAVSIPLARVGSARRSRNKLPRESADCE
jgi:hypothetical protein